MTCSRRTNILKLEVVQREQKGGERMPRNKVSQLRKKKGLEQKELAKTLNISVWHLNKIENHKKPLTLTTALKMAEFFNVTLNDIFFKE